MWQQHIVLVLLTIPHFQLSLCLSPHYRHAGERYSAPLLDVLWPTSFPSNWIILGTHVTEQDATTAATAAPSPAMLYMRHKQPQLLPPLAPQRGHQQQQQQQQQRRADMTKLVLPQAKVLTSERHEAHGQDMVGGADVSAHTEGAQRTAKVAELELENEHENEHEHATQAPSIFEQLKRFGGAAEHWLASVEATDSHEAEAETTGPRSDGRKLKRIKKKFAKLLLPLLIAYKLKFLTLIPVLIGGLTLLVGTTGLAGFFFALFTAVMTMRATGAGTGGKAIVVKAP